MVEKWEIPHHRFGKMIRFKLDDVDRWVEGNRREVVDIEKEAVKLLKGINRRPKMDIDALVRKTIAEEKSREYILNHGKPDQIKGLRKEVGNGTF
jgi:hypothetical protein